MRLVDITFEMGIKSEILASGDIYFIKICLRLRVMFLAVFTDRYDPKQASKNVQWVLVPNKKYSYTTALCLL